MRPPSGRNPLPGSRPSVDAEVVVEAVIRSLSNGFSQVYPLSKKSYRIPRFILVKMDVGYKSKSYSSPQVEGSPCDIGDLSRGDEGGGDGGVLVGVEGDKVVVDGVDAHAAVSGEVEVRMVGQVHRGGLRRQCL